MPHIDRGELYLLTVLTIYRGIEFTRSNRVRQAVAARIGHEAYEHSLGRRKKMRAKVDAIFGGCYSNAELDEVVRATFRTFWDDAFYLCRMDMRAAMRAVQVRGLEHIREALQRGRGAILLENSFFGYRNLPKWIVHAQGWTAHQTHSADHIGGFGAWGATPIADGIIRPFFDRRELQFANSILYFPREASLAFTRRLTAMLDANELIYISGDGQYGQKHIETEFLGHTRHSATGAVSLAKFTGAPILPMFCLRCAPGSYELIIEPPLDVPNHAQAAEVAMRQYSKLLEGYVRRNPEQYRHWYRFGEP